MKKALLFCIVGLLCIGSHAYAQALGQWIPLSGKVQGTPGPTTFFLNDVYVGDFREYVSAGSKVKFGSSTSEYTVLSATADYLVVDPVVPAGTSSIQNWWYRLASGSWRTGKGKVYVYLGTDVVTAASFIPNNFYGEVGFGDTVKVGSDPFEYSVCGTTASSICLSPAYQGLPGSDLTIYRKIGECTCTEDYCADSATRCNDYNVCTTDSCNTDNGDCSYTTAANCYHACNLPWGGTIEHGKAVTAYVASSVPCGSICQNQTRTCSDGILSGSYTQQSCSVQACPSWKDVSGEGNLRESCRDWLTRTGQAGTQRRTYDAFLGITEVGNCTYRIGTYCVGPAAEVNPQGGPMPSDWVPVAGCEHWKTQSYR